MLDLRSSVTLKETIRLPHNENMYTTEVDETFPLDFIPPGTSGQTSTKTDEKKADTGPEANKFDENRTIKNKDREKTIEVKLLVQELRHPTK